MKAKKILKSDLLIKKNCRTICGEVYEKLKKHPSGLKYRQFYTDDDYDYVTCKFTITLLNKYFKHTKH
jgi:hypothetical protein